MSVLLCYSGSLLPLPERRVLRAGSLTATYEAGDLRYVTVRGIEVCRRWYATVRDHNWGTVPGKISDEQIEETADGFRVTYTSTHRQGDIHFVWHAAIVGTPGAISFTFDGEAKAEFRRNRIGFCVLHPPRECAGQRVVLNSRDESRFPDVISPWNPFKDLKQLSHMVAGGDWVHWHFEGDLFETEDQRNWIDASFKTFCTPLSVPFPVTVRPGEHVRQSVKLRIEFGTAEIVNELVGKSNELKFSPVQLADRLPAIGLAICGPLRPTELTRLRHLKPAHLRVEVDVTKPGYDEALRVATESAKDLDCTLELALTVSEAVWSETQQLIAVLQKLQPRLARVLAFSDRDWSTPDRIILPIVEALARYDATIPVYAGTTANYTELNRGRPTLSHANGVCYSIQPQEHAFDNASLVECCSIVADTVRSARQFVGDKPIAVTPITLRKRMNPYATGPEAPTPPGVIPATVDVRQTSLFGAAWTLGVLKYLAESKVSSATFYEATGPLGVMETSDGSNFPEQFPSRPDMVYPLFHVLADVIEWSHARVLRCLSPDPLQFDALALKAADGERRILLANMTNQKLNVELNSMPTIVRIRTLDETTFDFATMDPIAFRRTYEKWLISNHSLSLTLKPYAYVRIDG